jgi:hypothetical protein
MRIFKDLPYNHLDDKFYNKNSPLGLLIDKLKAALENEAEFLELLGSIIHWDYPKISLWAFEDILNYIDTLMEINAHDDVKLLQLLKFLNLLLKNSLHKDIFASFDNLQKIFRGTFDIRVKIEIVDMYSIFSEVKKTTLEYNIEFINSCAFLVDLRQLLVDFILGIKSSETNGNITNAQSLINQKLDYLFLEVEKQLVSIIREEGRKLSVKDKKFDAFLNEIKNQFKNMNKQNQREEKVKILQEVKVLLENSFIKKEDSNNSNKDDLIFKETIMNLFILISNLNYIKEVPTPQTNNIQINNNSLSQINQLNTDLINTCQFTLNTLNLMISVSQKKVKVPLVSEYYIEKYLKDVLEVITSGFSLELKSVFLMATIGFVTYFDGYENILFQNGLFHSILSDLTSSKFNSNINELEVLTYEDTVNQDFFNTILVFLYRTSSFKEIPVHFLNKVLELPKNNVYPYRLDNVVLSLKKKRTFEENILDELVIPRLIYELNNFWIDPAELSYLENQYTKTSENKRYPTIFERSVLIQKLFKILYVIFENNTNSSSVRYYEGKIIDAVNFYIKTVVSKCNEMNSTDIGFYEPLLVSCVDLIVRICDILPSKIPTMIEMSSITNIFNYFSQRIPCQSNIINLMFFLFSTLSKNEEGAKFLNENENANKVINKIFDVILSKDDYFFSNVFTPSGFISEEFYNPYNAFLNMENSSNKSIIAHFFGRVRDTIKELKNKVDKILTNEDEDIKRDEILIKFTDNTSMSSMSNFNIHSMRFSHTLHLLGQFFMNITQEDKDALMTDNFVDLQNLILEFYELVFHPIILYSLNSTVISSTMVKGVFSNNPEKLFEHLNNLLDKNLDMLNIGNRERINNNSSSGSSGSGSNNSNNFNNLNISDSQDKMLVDQDQENEQGQGQGPENETISNTPNFDENQKNRILSKLVHLVEFTIKKLFSFLKSKEPFISNFISKLTIIMQYLVRQQSNINVYLSPINDSVLVVNGKHNYKFLSSNMNPNLRQILIEQTKSRYNIKNENLPSPTKGLPDILIYNENEYMDIKQRHNFETNMKIEIIDESSPFSNEMTDANTKIILNSHMPILEFFITIAKTLRNAKNLTNNDIETIKCWNSLGFNLNLVLKSLPLKNYLSEAERVFNTQGDLSGVVSNFIYFINILNNINIVLGDKVVSPYLTYQFIKFGGVESLFDISEFLLSFSNIINSGKEKESPLIILLLIKNLWNIVTSILMRLVKFSPEGNNVGIILQKENFTSMIELSSSVKLRILNNINNRFLSTESKFKMKDISVLSFSFHSMILSISDTCINAFKLVQESKSENFDEKLIEEVMKMGFSRADIQHAITIGKRTVENIVNYLIIGENMEDNDEEEPELINQNQQENQQQSQQGEVSNNANNANDANDENQEVNQEINQDTNNNINQGDPSSSTQQVKKVDLLTQPNFDEDSIKPLIEAYTKIHHHQTFLNQEILSQHSSTHVISSQLPSTGNNLKEDFLKIFSTLYNVLLDDQVNGVKISQIRKMNILFRIKEILNIQSGFTNKLLVPFLREIFAFEREIFIDLKESLDNDDSVRKLLHNRMLINYIIVKDRTRASNIFENLDIDEVAEFFNEFNVIDSSLISMRFTLNSLDKIFFSNEKKNQTGYLDEKYINHIKNLIYESLFIVHLAFLFLTYYKRFKTENYEEGKVDSEGEDYSKYDIKKYSKDFYSIISDLIELQLKLNVLTTPNSVSSPIILDEQNLIIIFSIINENFEYDEHISEFVEKGALKKILKLRRSFSTIYESFNDSKFKYKVVFDEIFRMFLFKIFEDNKLEEGLLESIFKYIVANIYNTKSEVTYAGNHKKKISRGRSKSKSKDKEVNEVGEQIEISQVEQGDQSMNLQNQSNEENNNNNNNNISSNNNITNYKSNLETTENEKDTSNSNHLIEINFDDFITSCYPLIPRSREIFINIMKKMFVVDKKIEKQLKSVGKKKKNQPQPSNETTTVTLVLKVQPEYNQHILQIAGEMKNSTVKEGKDLANLNQEEINVNVNSQPSQNTQNNTHNIPLPGTPPKSKENKEYYKKSQSQNVENQILKINKQFSSNKVSIINSLIKHIWDLTTDMDKEIEKNMSHTLNINLTKQGEKENNNNTNIINNNFNLTPKYLVDLDTSLIALANLINTYPSVLSIVLKYHQRPQIASTQHSNHKRSKDNVKEDPNTNKTGTGFITYLLKKIFYVMQFYRNCLPTNSKFTTNDNLTKEKEDVIRCLGFEANSHQSVLEACRNYNIISYLMHAICYRRRNMNSSDTFIINKSRKKILKELDSIISELKPKDDHSLTVRNILLFKVSIFCLYSLTELHDNSHVYSQTNPFEISKLLISSSGYDIIKNIVDIMKHSNLSSNINFNVHKLSTLFLSELLKYIRINPKINIKNTMLSKDDQPKAKLLFKTLTNSSGGLIIEADILDEDLENEGEEGEEEAENNLDQDIQMQVDENQDNLNEDEESEEDEDDEDDLEDEEDEDDEDMGNSEEDFFYSNDEDEDEDNSDESNESDELDEDEDEDEDSQLSDEPNRPVIELNLNEDHQINDDEEDFDDEDNDEDEENFDDEDNEDDFAMNDGDEHNTGNDVSVQFNDNVNEFMNLERDDESNFDNDDELESDMEVVFTSSRPRGGPLLYGHNHPAGRRANLNSILINNNEAANIPQESADEVLFLQHTYEKPGKGEVYFEENITFPFMLLNVNDELYEFCKPGIYISMINKVTRSQLDAINLAFQYRYVSPFDKKCKRNLPFALNKSRDKLMNDYNKELHRMETSFNKICSDEMFRSYISPIDSVENMKEYISRQFGIDLKELKEKKESKEGGIKIIEEGDSQSTKKENNRGEKKRTNIDKEREELIDPEFLEHIPEDLREDVLQNEKKLMEDSNVINQYYNPEDIDPDLISAVNPDILPETFVNRNNINNNQQNQNRLIEEPEPYVQGQQGQGQGQSSENPENQQITNTANNPSEYDAVEFINSLPLDIREEVLMTSSEDFLESLPQAMRDEAQRLRELNGFAFIESHMPILEHHIPASEIIPAGNFYNPFSSLNAFLGSTNKISLEKKFTLKPPKYTFEEILSVQKHQKEQTAFIVNTFDESIIENLVSFNIKQTSEPAAKTKINTNPYWVLINTLMQNTNLRFKILDILISIWILDSICLKKLLKENPELHTKLANHENQNSLLNYVYQLYIENKTLEEFFFDDYDQFIRNFCDNFPNEMKKFFLETNYTEKGEYVSLQGKKYSISKHITAVKELLQISYEKQENVLSNLIRIMLINSKSDIKKIFALKIFTKIVTKCLYTVGGSINKPLSIMDATSTDKNLRISEKTIEMIVNLFYNFETILKISKDKKSNNPTLLLCEMIADHKCFKLLLDVLLHHIEKLNEGVSYEMDHFFIQKNVDINEFSKPLPENVLFKIIKLVNQINQTINKDSPDEKNKFNMLLEPNHIPEESENSMNESQNREDNQNEMIVDQEDNQIINSEINFDSDQNALSRRQSKISNKSETKEKSKKSQKIKQELNEFIKQVNSMLLKCWEKLDLLLFEVSKMMKEDQKIIDPKLNRLIPYLEAFITLSHLQFLPENKAEMSNNPFIMEAAYKRTPKKTPQKHFLSNTKDQLDLHFNDFFFKFSEKNKKVINLILRRYPKMFPPELLIKISHILDIENKKKYFKYELKKLKANRDYHMNLRIKRDRIFMDSYSQLRSKKPEEIRGKLTVTFVGEEMAIDAGGVKREWFTLLSREMFNPDFMLFKLAANGSTYMPNSESGMFESDHLQIFSFIGRVIAKAIYDGFMLDCYFTRNFYKLLCNTPLTYHDMEDYDPVFYKNLKWLLETDISDMGELYTFSYEEDRFGKLEVVDLIPDGRNISVTEENKFEYVQKLCYARLFETIKPQMEALQKGFYEIIPLKLITIFDHRELELVISGLPTIDVNDLKNNTIYENYTVDSQIIKWFWEIFETYDNDERCEFIQFVTGSSKVPLEGFSALQGIGGTNKFKISKVFDRNFDRLPINK